MGMAELAGRRIGRQSIKDVISEASHRVRERGVGEEPGARVSELEEVPGRDGQPSNAVRDKRI